MSKTSGDLFDSGKAALNGTLLTAYGATADEALAGYLRAVTSYFNEQATSLSKENLTPPTNPEIIFDDMDSYLLPVVEELAEKNESSLSQDILTDLSHVTHSLAAAYYARYDHLLDIIGTDRLDVALSRRRFYAERMAPDARPKAEESQAQQTKAVKRLINEKIKAFGATNYVTVFHDGDYKDALDKIEGYAHRGIAAFAKNNDTPFDGFEETFRLAQANAARNLAKAIEMEMDLRAKELLSLKQIASIDSEKMIHIISGEAARLRHFRVEGRKIAPDADLPEKMLERLLRISEPRLRNDYFRLMRLAGATSEETKSFMKLYHQAAAKQGKPRLILLKKYADYYVQGAGQGYTPNPGISRLFLSETLRELYAPSIAQTGKADMSTAQAEAFNNCYDGLAQIIQNDPDRRFPFNNPTPPSKARGTLPATKGWLSSLRGRLGF